MIVIVSKPGLLANDLFLFGHFIAAAAEYEFRIANPSFNDSAPFFASTAADPLVRYPPVKTLLPAVQRYRDGAFGAASVAASLLHRAGSKHVVRLDWHEAQDLTDPDFLARARTDRMLIVQGWLFRSESLFVKHTELLRQFFTPIEPVRDTVRTTIGSGSKSALTVGVHVRQGDYRTFKGGRYFYPSEVYARLMRNVEALFLEREVRFIVCSDERQDPSVYRDLNWMSGPGSPIGDLYTLAATDLIIGPPSTFSLWASFYGSTQLHHISDPDSSIELEHLKSYEEYA